MDRPISIPTLIPVSAIMSRCLLSFLFLFTHFPLRKCAGKLSRAAPPSMHGQPWKRREITHRRRKTLSRCNRGFHLGWIVVTEPIRRQRWSWNPPRFVARSFVGRRNLALTPSFLILEERLISRILLCLCRLVACYSRLVAILIA